ncbi:MmcQ/YjbR family DNA-binding protein [Amycolatopsis lexingtonensis]|uniref:MmcQ/YjbR family DNA-binding protein n=1 Tax=Amycolatopsis lexingtonensis TaxID=218822 RepID=UPI003F6F2436
MVTGDEVRAFAATLPRAYEAIVRDRVKFRIGQIVFLALSRDETVMGFAFPREQREALIAGEPEKFLLPEPSDLRFRWVQCRLAAIDPDEMRELVVEAWRMCVPKKVSSAYLDTHPL